MTRPGFTAQVSAISKTKAEIFRRHFNPTTMLPAEAVKSSMRCLACGGVVTYSASPTNGSMSGHCSSLGCIRWND